LRSSTNSRERDRAGIRRHATVRGDPRDALDARREQLRATLPIRRVVRPDDVAALAVDLMTNTAVTGATFDIDGGQQLLES
jgi:NAD(P)-dependent dehydrogenase (short-subunit alcohol dehydrogenase family)